MADEAVKIGARNNQHDKATVRAIRKAAAEIVDHTRNLEPEDEDEPKGAPVKADMVIDLPEVSLQWVTVKAGAEEWTLDVLGVPFGGPYDGKDRDKQYFDASTNIYQDFYKVIPAVYAHGATPTGKRASKAEIIGTATYSHKTAQGHWYKVILDKASELARRIWASAKAGKARASSGSLAQMVRYSANGHIEEWPVCEMTLVDVDTSNFVPANPYAVAIPIMKAVYEAAGLPFEQQPEATPQGGETHAGAADKSVKTLEGVLEMSDELETKVAQAVADALKAERDAAAKAKEAAEIEAIRKENEAMKAQLAADRRLPNGAPVVRQYADVDKFDGLDAAEVGLLIDTLKGAGRDASPAAYKALALKVARSEDAYAKAALKAHIGDISDATIKALAEKAATDPQYSTLSGFGSSFVGTAYSAQLWEAIRAESKVVSRIPSVVIPDGYSSEYFPIEGADPTWYKVAETTANDSTMKIPVATVTHSQMATANKQITVAKMGARASFTGELSEDSLIAWEPQLRKQLEISGREMMEYVVIDGDTATSSNINDIGGTTYSGAATSLFLLTNGFRKSPLVTTTTQSRSAAGGFVVEDYLETLKLLGSNGLGASNPQQCGFIVDPNTWYASAGLPEAKDRNQNVLVVDNGFVSRAYGIEVIPSWFMHYNSATRKANTAGKVDQDTVANNAYGAIVAVRFDQWKLAYKRRMTIETVRRPESDTWDVVALTRWGLGQRDTVAAAETYYVGI